VRVVLMALTIAVVIVALLPLLRPHRTLGRLPPGTPDELVKDPVCGTYIVRSRAVSRAAGEGSRYFCSRECASRFGG
jgi:YHS domain-containing protein